MKTVGLVCLLMCLVTMFSVPASAQAPSINPGGHVQRQPPTHAL